jgi:hypothetical protein
VERLKVEHREFKLGGATKARAAARARRTLGRTNRKFTMENWDVVTIC